jgi:HEAT repeat protein
MVSPEFHRVLDAIQGTQSKLSYPALYGLSGLEPEEREHLSQIWPDIELQQKIWVLQSLLEIAEASFLVDFASVFHLALEDEHAEVRRLAVQGLWEDRSWRWARILIRLVREDPSDAVRAAAAMALGSFVLDGELHEEAEAHSAQVCDALFDVLGRLSDAMEVRRRALESLAYSSDSKVSALIEAAYESEELPMKVSALFAMGRSADPAWAPIILQELASGEAEMRYEATRACGELQVADAIPLLGALTQDHDREVQETAIWALGQIGGREARRLLEDCYELSDDSIHEAVEEALANMSLIDESFGLAYHELLDEEVKNLEDLEESGPHGQGKAGGSGSDSQ